MKMLDDTKSAIFNNPVLIFFLFILSLILITTVFGFVLDDNSSTSTVEDGENQITQNGIQFEFPDGATTEGINIQTLIERHKLALNTSQGFNTNISIREYDATGELGHSNNVTAKYEHLIGNKYHMSKSEIIKDRFGTTEQVNLYYNTSSKLLYEKVNIDGEKELNYRPFASSNIVDTSYTFLTKRIEPLDLEFDSIKKVNNQKFAVYKINDVSDETKKSSSTTVTGQVVISENGYIKHMKIKGSTDNTLEKLVQEYTITEYNDISIKEPTWIEKIENKDDEEEDDNVVTEDLADVSIEQLGNTIEITLHNTDEKTKGVEIVQNTGDGQEIVDVIETDGESVIIEYTNKEISDIQDIQVRTIPEIANGQKYIVKVYQPEENNS